MVLKGSGLQSQCFPSRAYLIETLQGLYLWDTGYSEHFRDATSTGAYRLYPLVTPVSFGAHDSLRGQLKAFGVQPDDIHTLVLSHFHADHIAGMRDFPNARLLSAAAGWEAVRKLSGLAAVRQAFVPGLIPADIEARLEFVEGKPAKALPAELAPFESGWDITGNGELMVVSLPGHVLGHLGAFVLGDQGWTLLASDAAWLAESYEQMRGPSELSFLIQHNRKAYYQTLGKLHALHKSGKVPIRLTHESAVDYKQGPST
jgi:glyoxylase-like metal-dependent hydrolase (beta-lactamase superfamily II)